LACPIYFEFNSFTLFEPDFRGLATAAIDKDTEGDLDGAIEEPGSEWGR